MKRAVIFDLDGLLIDSEVVSHRLMDELLRQYGYSLTKAEYARIYSGKTGIGNMTHMIETYHLPLTVAEGMGCSMTGPEDPDILRLNVLA